MSKKHSFLAKLLVMILCLALVFTGCSGTSDADDTDEPKAKTPEAQLSYSADKTLGAMLNTDSATEVFMDALSKGKITIDVMGQVENVLYIDTANSYFADFLNLNIDGEELELSAYLKDTAMAVMIPAVLGNQAYGIDLETLETDLKNSAFWDLAGVSYEDFIAEYDMDIDQMVDTVVATLDSIGTLEKAIEEAAKEIEIGSAEGKATIYGEEVDATVITIQLTSDDIKAMVDAYIDWLEQTANDMVADLSESMGGMDLDSELGLSDAFAEMRDEVDAGFEEVDLTLDATVNIDPKTEYMMSFELDIAGTLDGEQGAVSMDLILGKNPAASDKYTLSISAEENGEATVQFDAILTRALSDTKDVTELSVTVTEDGETNEVFNGRLEYNKESYEYELSLEADGSEVSVNGTLQYTDDVFDFYIDTLSMDGYEQTVDVRVSVEAVSEMPNMPTYKNILTMSADELTELIEDISSFAG